jgi:hypothetical protein
LWESQAQRLRRFQIQHQLQLRWSLYRQFGGLAPLKIWPA